METSNNFIEKLQRNLKGILEIFKVLLKICPEVRDWNCVYENDPGLRS